MSFEGLRAVTDPAAGAWIAPRLGHGWRAGGVVPRGYAAYARVLHPVDASRPLRVRTWAEVCERTGRTPHALVRWEDITVPAPGVRLPVTLAGQWDQVSAHVGALDATVLAPLLDALAPSTGDQDCFHALWGGRGWLHGGDAVAVLTADDVDEPAEDPADAPSGCRQPPAPAALREALAGPRLRLPPDRDHLLFRGPLHAALSIGEQTTPDHFHGWSPNLLWPADRSWCLGTDIDLDSTVVGGPTALVDAVLAAPGVEAWPVGEDDDLSPWGPPGV
ncbi:hypothetical protein [Kineococcus sp. SYSU DK004]|uniref:hypothetical protein n=1 Tax=Kineococcus sp. SYSU DK004 TaxID=3383125 RepID=UPI003D7E9384